mmetsp:Transcript_7048/g.20795  ORF Transcript_7048/g.20795 Transcript_7048/m.20795 type:complete len:233 (+) Transcript_7048:3-701(+)
MIGDCTTEPGGSLSVIMAEGYGSRFYITYCVGMIVIMFGLFNIITAIFVDSTISGLKHNDTKRKFAKQYESQFVRKKLKILMERVEVLMMENERASGGATPTRDMFMTEDDPFRMGKEQFKLVMEDDQVKDLLNDLDVQAHTAGLFFETFDPNEDGAVSTSEFVDGVLKLRGEPQKHDMIASLVAIKAIGDKVDNLWENIRLNQKRIQDNLGDIQQNATRLTRLEETRSDER